MHKEEIIPERGLLTFISEGNSNPYSKFYSRKLHLSHKNTVVLGRGYDMKKLSEKEIYQDLSSIGVPHHKAKTVSKASGLEGIQAQRFVEFYANEVVLSAEQEFKLFNKQYEEKENELWEFIEKSARRYGTIFLEYVPNYQREILVDLMFNGDLDQKTLDFLLPQLKTSIDYRRPRIFDLVILDMHYWSKQGVSPDRIKMRCIYVNEWRSFLGNKLSNYNNILEIHDKDHDNHNLGMSDKVFEGLIIQSPNLFSIEGFYIDYKKDELSMVLKKQAPLPYISYLKEDQLNTNLEDLVISLKMFYDQSIKTKIIGAALQPYDITTRDFDNIKPEWYPDNYLGKGIVKGSKFGESMMEAIMTVAQLSTGYVLRTQGQVMVKCEPFECPEELRDIGLLTLDEFQLKRGYSSERLGISTNSRMKYKLKELTTRNVTHIKKKDNIFLSPRTKISISGRLTTQGTTSSQNSVQLPVYEKNLVRFWLIVKDVHDQTVKNFEGEFYLIKDVKIVLEPRRILVNSKGVVEEVPIEDTHDPAFLFARKFNENYDLIAKYFPVLKRLKHMVKALTLAEWVKKQKIPVDLVMINSFFQRELLYISSSKRIVFKDQYEISQAYKEHKKLPRIKVRRPQSDSDSDEEPQNVKMNQNPTLSQIKFPTGKSDLTSIRIESKETEGLQRISQKDAQTIMPVLLKNSSKEPMHDLKLSTQSTLLKDSIRMTTREQSLIPVQVNNSKENSILKPSRKEADKRPRIFISSIATNDEKTLQNVKFLTPRKESKEIISDKIVTYSVQDLREAFNSCSTRDKKTYIYTGVLLNFIKNDKDDNFESKAIKEFEERQETLTSQISMGNSAPKMVGNIFENISKNSIFTVSFPFQNATCKVCEKYLRYSEIMFPINEIYYCRLHHPNSCNYCFNIIKGNFITIDQAKYHYDCLICRQCDTKIVGKLIKTKEGFIHMECTELYLRKLVQANKLDELFEVIYLLTQLSIQDGESQDFKAFERARAVKFENS